MPLKKAWIFGQVGRRGLIPVKMRAVAAVNLVVDKPNGRSALVSDKSFFLQSADYEGRELPG